MHFLSKSLFVILISSSDAIGDELFAVGSNFKIPSTQDVEFVPLKRVEDAFFKKKAFPRFVDLRSEQSAVKSQGERGSCSYFVVSSLVESLIKKKYKKELDISEEYLAWAAKVKNKLRSYEEDSSVAVNALTVQKFGFMLEKDMPYQLSWFNSGMQCEGKKGSKDVDPICYSHKGPEAKNLSQIIEGKFFVFETVGSGSADVVQALAHIKSPVTAFILAHSSVWHGSWKTGKIILTKKLKKTCGKKGTGCSAHAVLITGYDLGNRTFTFKNSWGEEWGDNGYGSISFDYMDQMSPRKFLTGYVAEDAPETFGDLIKKLASNK